MRGASAFYIGGAVACTAAARQALTPGGAVQADPITPTLKAPGH